MRDSTKTLTCGLVQMSSGDNWQQNLGDAETLIRTACLKGAEFVVLPENALCFGQTGLKTFEPYVAPSIAHLQTLANELGCYLLCGSVPIKVSEEATRYRSRSYLLSPDGAAVYYDKIHLFDVDVADDVGAYRESDTYEAGSEPITTELAGHKLGFSVCYDLRFPELYQCYQKQGATLLTVPSAFTYKTGRVHWEILLRARAVETQSFVLAANQCGDHGKGRVTWGHSMIVAPDGQVLASCGDAPSVCVAELDSKLLEQVRAAMPLQQHKRLV